MPKRVILENKVLNYRGVLNAMSNNVLPLVVSLNKNQAKRLKKCKDKIDSLLIPQNYMNKFEILALLYSGKRYGDDEQYVSISFKELYKLIALNKISVEFLKNDQEEKYIEDLEANESNSDYIVVTDNGGQESHELDDLVIEAIKKYEKELIKDNQEKDLENKAVTLDELFGLIDSNVLPTVVKATLDQWLLAVNEDDTNYPLSFLKYFYHLYDNVLGFKSEDMTYYLGINSFKLKKECPSLRYLIDGSKTYKISEINQANKSDGNNFGSITFDDNKRTKFDELFSYAIYEDKNKEQEIIKAKID